MNLLRMKKTLAWVLFAALLLPILAACGGTPAPGATGGTTGSTAASPAAGTTTDASVAASETTAASPAAEASPSPAAATSPDASAATGGTGDTGTAEAGVLRLVGHEPENLDPQKASFVVEIQHIMMVYEGLMTFDEEGKPVPAAAESVDISEDGKTYTFNIDPDSKYSDGTPVTAQNFEYAWKRLANPETAGEYQSLPCGIIAGYDEYSAVACQGMTVTETAELDMEALEANFGVRAIDDQTLEIQLVNPAPYFLSMAALWIGAPVREQDVEAGEDWWTDPENFIGNGPFVLTEFDPAATAVFEPNENWRGPELKLQRVVYNMIEETQVAFQAYQAGELDVLNIAAEDLPAVQADPQLSQQVIDIPGSCTSYIGFNVTKAPFDNRDVRRAFAQAFDREAWVRDVLQGLGEPAHSFIPPGFPGFLETDALKFDPAAAKAALATAGFENGQGLPEIRATFGSTSRNRTRWEFIANQFRENLGVDIVLDPVDPTAYTALLKSPETLPQMYQSGWCADYPDPQNWISLWRTGGVLQARGGYSNPQLDELTTQADIAPEGPERLETYNQAHRLLIEDAPIIFTSHSAGQALVKPWVQGITEETVTPLDYWPGFFNLENIQVQP